MRQGYKTANSTSSVSGQILLWTRQENIVAWIREETLEREMFIGLRYHLKTEPAGHSNGSEVKDKREPLNFAVY